MKEHQITDPHYRKISDDNKWVGDHIIMEGIVLYLVSFTSSYNHNFLIDPILKELVNYILEVPDTRYNLLYVQSQYKCLHIKLQ